MKFVLEFRRYIFTARRLLRLTKLACMVHTGHPYKWETEAEYMEHGMSKKAQLNSSKLLYRQTRLIYFKYTM